MFNEHLKYKSFPHNQHSPRFAQTKQANFKANGNDSTKNNSGVVSPLKKILAVKKCIQL